MHCKIRVCLPVCLPKRRTSGTTTQNFSESAHECHETNPFFLLQALAMLAVASEGIKSVLGGGWARLIRNLWEAKRKKRMDLGYGDVYFCKKKKGEDWLYPPPTHTHPVSTPIPWLVFTVIMFTHSVAIIMILNILIIILQG